MPDDFITQIYEIQTPFEAETVIGLGVNRVGSVLLSEDMWNDQGIRETISLVATSDAESSLIPLFTNPDAIFRSLAHLKPDIVHFCETLTDDQEWCEKLVKLQLVVREKFPEIRIMRSIPIGEPGRSGSVGTLDFAALFEPVSDLFLTDTMLMKKPGKSGARQPVPGFVGITGRTCDWGMAGNLVKMSHIPVILAGGISPGNVFEALCRVRPAGVDSCTLTNALDSAGCPVRFKKDVDKVECFVRESRRAEDFFREKM